MHHWVPFSSAADQHSGHWRSTVRRLALGLLAVLLVAVPATVHAQTSGELESIREERRKAQEEAARQAKVVDAANVEVDELTEALETLQKEVNAAQDRVDDAQRGLEDAEARLREAEQAVEDQVAEIERLKDQLAERAISSFVNQGSEASLIIESSDPNQAVRMRTLVEDVTQGEVEVQEQLRSAEEDLEIQRALALETAEEASQYRRDMETELGILDAARQDQADLTAEAEARLDQELGELASVRDLDADLAADEQAEIDRLADELRKKNTPPPSAGGDPAASGGGGGQPSVPVGADEIVSVRGIQVHRSIADAVGRMLDAAAADGIVLSGGGYRSSAGQIAVRRANCGTSDYAVFEMPPSQCRPPTARPGSSQHEKGLAIDFTYNGRLIRSRDNDGYRWLAAHGADYGFKNLPSEPWHWSTTGR